MRRATPLILFAGAVMLQACVSSPKETVLNLDTTDRKWTSRQCVAARKEVAAYNDGALTRGVVGVVGNLAAPFAGTAASLGLSAVKDKDREKLNHRVRAACVSDPLKGKTPPRRRVASR